MIGVLLVDDQAVVRDGLRVILEAQDDITVVGEAEDGRAAVELARTRRPDVVMMDIRMPVMDGVEATRRIAEAGTDGARVLVLTTFGDDAYVYDALRAGAAGFLLKDAPIAELSSAIRRAVAGERIVDPGLAAAALSEGASPLTRREQEVLVAARQHATVAQVAAALHLSPGTTRNHLSAIMGKLGAHSRIEALRIAEERGWL
jgi:two-component system response regulator DesR